MKDLGAKLTLFLTFCTAALLLVATCYAQAPLFPGGQPPSVEQELARMTQVLTLTEAQTRAILPILEDRHQEIGILLQNGADWKAQELRVHAIFLQTDSEIEVLLADRQQVLFDSIKPSRRPTLATERAGQ